ncbi:MAG: FAD-binding oxidoreductase [Acidobacteria bacterium]|nr:FAD-binding oxidoreductase [Acidobacteriota bacterium]
MSDLRWQNSLQQILGPQGLTSQPDAIRRWEWEGSPPCAIAFPESREQVGELIRLADAERLRLIPFGRGTKLRQGGASQPADLALSLQRLNKVCDYPASDLTISVEAGVSIRDLGARLGTQGQMLPLDVPFAERATIGGTVAANSSGPSRLSYGTWRDIVLGVQFVTADGKLAKGGGKVVKNVAGYDIPKLMIGSLGSLAVIVEITFKVFPIPPASATIALHLRSAEQASRAVLRVLNSPLIPQALDLVDSAAGTLANQPELRPAPFTLLAGVTGSEEVLARFEHELPALVRAEGLERFEVFRERRQAELWNAVQEITPSFLATHPEGLVVKASLPLDRMGEFIRQAHAASEKHGIAQATVARAGSGVVYTYLHAEPGIPEAVGSESLCGTSDRLIRKAERCGGRAIVEWCPVELKSKVNLWGTLGDDFASMRLLKAALDPQNILSPGRFYGGI